MVNLEVEFEIVRIQNIKVKLDVSKEEFDSLRPFELDCMVMASDEVIRELDYNEFKENLERIDITLIDE